jgi:hypothetical protein
MPVEPVEEVGAVEEVDLDGIVRPDIAAARSRPRIAPPLLEEAGMVRVAPPTFIFLVFISLPFLKDMPLLASLYSLAAFEGMPTFFANAGLWAAASINRFWDADFAGIKQTAL